MTNIITDSSNDRKYFAMTPNIVWAKCEDPYEHSLWYTVKMIAGDSGECILSTEDLATLSMMSTGKVSMCRKSLLDKGLLVGEFRRDPGYPQPVWHLSIPDLWKVNVDWATENQGLLERIQYKRQQKELLTTLRSKNTEPSCSETVEPSPHEGGVSPHEGKEPSPHEGGVSPHEGGVSPHETNKIQYKIHIDPKEEGDLVTCNYPAQATQSPPIFESGINRRMNQTNGQSNRPAQAATGSTSHLESLMNQAHERAAGRYGNRQQQRFDDLKVRLAKYGLNHEQFNQMVDCHLSNRGTLVLANDSGDRYADNVLSEAQQFVLDLCEKGRRFWTVTGPQLVWDSWNKNIKLPHPTDRQLMEHASMMVSGKVAQKPEEPAYVPAYIRMEQAQRKQSSPEEVQRRLMGLAA